MNRLATAAVTVFAASALVVVTGQTPGGARGAGPDAWANDLSPIASSFPPNVIR